MYFYILLYYYVLVRDGTKKKKIRLSWYFSVYQLLGLIVCGYCSYALGSFYSTADISG